MPDVLREHDYFNRIYDHWHAQVAKAVNNGPSSVNNGRENYVTVDPRAGQYVVFIARARGGADCHRSAGLGARAPGARALP